MDWATEYDILNVPGLGGSGDEHWQTFWEQANPRIRRVEQGDWDNPMCPDWTRQLENRVAEVPEKKSILVGHSLGCGTIIHSAARGNSAGVLGAFLVALPDIEREDFPPECIGFSPMPRSPLPFPGLMIASEDDPYASLNNSTEWAEILQVPLINIGRRDHIGSAAKLEFWEEGQKLLQDFIAKLTDSNP